MTYVRSWQDLWTGMALKHHGMTNPYMKYNGERYIIRIIRYRLKISTRLTRYLDSMHSESHVWLNASKIIHLEDCIPCVMYGRHKTGDRGDIRPVRRHGGQARQNKGRHCYP